MKKNFAFIIILTLLVACAGGTGGGAGAAGGGGTTGSDTPAAGAVNGADSPTVISMIIQESSVPHISQVIEKFHEYQSDIYVDLTGLVNFEAVNQNILASHQAGNDYDLMFINHVDTLAYIRGGIIQSLDGFAAASGVDFGQILFQPLLEAGMFQGSLYSVTINTDTRVLAVNANLFAQHNLDFPTTLSQMLDAARTLTADGNFGFTNAITRHAFMSTYEQGVFLMSMGGRLYEIGDDGRAIATIDTPQMREFLEFNKSLLNYMPGDALTMLEDDGRRSFASGNVGMYIWGPWEFNLMPELDFDKQLIRIPAGANGSASTSGGFQVAIGSGSQNPEAAWEMLKFMTTNPEMAALSASGGLPPSDAAYNLPPFDDPMYYVFRDQMQNSHLPQVPVANLHEVVTEFDIYWQDFLFGNIDVEEAVTQAQASVQAVLDRVN